MLEQETEHIITTLTERTIGGKDTISLHHVLASEIPRCVKTYMHAETISRLTEDLHASPHFGRVDTSASGTERLIRSFVRSLAEGYIFERPAYLALLENAVHFLENYLCRPQWTIENFLFESGERISLQTILTKLDHTADYSYFKTILERIARQRGWTDIGRTDLRAMLAAIDDRIVKEHNARELALLAKPIFDFILLRDTPPDVPIPLKPILVFFEDKKMRILRDYIESISNIRQKTEITLDELTALVEDLYLGHTEPPAVPAPPIATESLLEDHAPTPGQEPGSGDTSETVPELGAGNAPSAAGDEGRTTDTTPHPGSRLDDGRVPPAEPPPPRNLALSLTFAGISDRTPSVPQTLARLHDLINPHAQMRFVRRLFDRDQQRFDEVLARLEECQTWKDASQYLLELYQTIKLDPYDAVMVEFTDTIHRRYANPGRGSE